MTKPNSYARRIPSAIKRYGLSVSSVATSLAVASLIQPVEHVAPLFFLAILMSAWFGGTGPGLLAALLATLAFNYFFLPPLYTLRVDPNYLFDLFVFTVSAVLVSSWSAASTRAETLLSQSNEQLRTEIAERKRAEELWNQPATGALIQTVR